MVEFILEVDFCERGWEVVHGVIEVSSKRQPGEGRGELIDGLIELTHTLVAQSKVK